MDGGLGIDALYFTRGIDAVLASGFHLAGMHEIEGITGIWRLLEKPPLWQMLSLVGLVAILGVTATCFRFNSRGGEPADALAWPVLFIALGCVSPLAWGYY